MLKAALFIDGPNTYYTAKAFNIRVDFSSLVNYVKHYYENMFLVRSAYATFVTDTNSSYDSSRKFDPVRKLTDHLRYAGFSVFTRNSKIFHGQNGKVVKNTSISLILSIEAIKLADKIDVLFLASGDGELVPLVNYMKEKGVKVILIATKEREAATLSDELRRSADGLIEIRDIIDTIKLDIQDHDDDTEIEIYDEDDAPDTGLRRIIGAANQ